MPKFKWLPLTIILACALGPKARAAEAAIDPDRAAICENRNGAETSAERVKACTEILNSASLTPAQQAATRVNRAWAYGQQNRLADALADDDRAVALNPRWFVAYNERAVVHLRSGRLDAAIADYDAALRLAPNAAYSHFGRGIALQRKGEIKRAEQSFAEARLLDADVDEVFRRNGLMH
jgi:tetratricopeptide (TPR) repeat protein